MRQLITYGAVGVFNTALGYAIIFACMYLLRLDAVVSNALGYGVGVVVSYALNKRFTFQSEAAARGELLRFILVFAFAYLLNLGVLLVCIRWWTVHAALAQVIAGVVYFIVSFLLNKYFVFRARQRKAPA